MNKLVIAMGLTILVLLVIISVQMPRLSSVDELETRSEALSAATKDLLREMDVHCTARASDLAGVTSCIEPALRRDDFALQSFRAFDERRNETGAFIIANEGVRTYDGESFVLSVNGVVEQRGCHIRSEILTDYTCRFTLSEPCTAGDVYEISYEENGTVSRLVTETC